MLSPEFLAIGGGSSGYAVKNSLRFRASNSAYLQRTPAGAGNRKTWTWSAWVKRGTLGGAVSMNLFVGDRAGGTDATYTSITFTTSDQLAVGGFATNWRITTAVFRDPTAWLHIVVALDTTQATAANRVRVYVNGSEITAFGTSNNPALNADLGINQAALHALGRDVAGGPTFFDGHMAHVYLIDGQALTPSSFGRTDAVTGEWVPTNYSGSYGTNGFRLSFEDATSTTTIGNDSSGAANHMTTSGVSVTAGTTFDQSLDTPTLGYPVWSPIDKATVTVSEAGTAEVAAADVHGIRATMALPASGKWYWEITVSGLGYGTGIGIANNASDLASNASSPQTRFYSFGSFFGAGSPQYGTNQAILGATNWAGASQPSANDVIMVAVDMDNGSMWIGRNGTWFNSSGTANPATNTDPRWTGLTGTTWFPYTTGYGSATPVTCRVNFGQRAFAYTPPSGFVALNTRNLPAPLIRRPRQYFDTRLRTGTGAAASVADLEFAPDLVWIKSRSAATTHNLFDTSRGATRSIQTTGANAEFVNADTLTAFNSNGYSLGADATPRGVNVSAATYVDWALKSGSLPGFNITLFTGDGTGARTINHGLGVTPQFMLVRGRDARVWAGYHTNLTSAAYYVDLGTTAAEAVDTTMFDSTAPNASSFRVGSYNNANLVNYLAYLFAEVPGFSRIGVYTGNNSTNGPFVWCGFRPRFILLKVNAVADWVMVDTARSTFNVVSDYSRANLANAESSSALLDVTASGFKVRSAAAGGINSASTNTLFIAFADVPFKYARAR